MPPDELEPTKREELEPAGNELDRQKLVIADKIITVLLGAFVGALLLHYAGEWQHLALDPPEWFLGIVQTAISSGLTVFGVVVIERLTTKAKK